MSERMNSRCATAVSHLVRAPGIAECDVTLVLAGGLDGRTARATRLLGHYARVREAIARVTRAEVRLELDDCALDAALL